MALLSPWCYLVVRVIAVVGVLYSRVGMLTAFFPLAPYTVPLETRLRKPVLGEEAFPTVPAKSFKVLCTKCVVS